jgi:hypothetical protein
MKNHQDCGRKIKEVRLKEIASEIKLNLNSKTIEINIDKNS